MARADFQLVGINQTFNAQNPTVTRQFPIEGQLNPTDDAYLLIQVHGVELFSHKIKINGKDLPLNDMPAQTSTWQTWMEHVPPDFLKKGSNTITFTRSGNDNFTIRKVVINWREK